MDEQVLTRRVPDTLDRSPPLQGWKAHRRGGAATLCQTRAVYVQLLSLLSIRTGASDRSVSGFSTPR
jgi:hypothetical protein